VFYVLVSGADPSIVRAAIMGMIVFSSQLFGRQQLGVYTLTIASLFILIVDPGLLYAVAFQLSVAATAGILFIKRYFDAVINISFIRENLSTTLAAQIGTLPILLTVFGSYSLISILSNLLILWMVPILMVFGGAAALVSFLHPVFSIVFLYLSLPLLVMFHVIIEHLSYFSKTITFEYIPFSFVVAYYLIVFAFMRVLRPRNVEVKSK